MTILDGHLLPNQSGTLHLGYDPTTTKELNPFLSIHQNSGVFHDSLYGQSGVVRFNQPSGGFVASRDGGANFYKVGLSEEVTWWTNIGENVFHDGGAGIIVLTIPTITSGISAQMAAHIGHELNFGNNEFTPLFFPLPDEVDTSAPVRLKCYYVMNATPSGGPGDVLLMGHQFRATNDNQQYVSERVTSNSAIETIFVDLNSLGYFGGDLVIVDFGNIWIKDELVRNDFVHGYVGRVSGFGVAFDSYGGTLNFVTAKWTGKRKRQLDP